MAWLDEAVQYEKKVLSKRGNPHISPRREVISGIDERTTLMMAPNPFLGVFFHWLGGLASGSFYVPYRGVKKWSWEVYWLVGGFFSWIIAPWVLALALVPDLVAIIRQADRRRSFWPTCLGHYGAWVA